MVLNQFIIHLSCAQVAQHLGWVGKGTMFDVLPLIIQANGGHPKIFEIPKEYVLEVDIKHPKYIFTFLIEKC